jgi:hypothetical protein
VLEGARVSIASGCPPVRARVKVRKLRVEGFRRRENFTLVPARWASCGDLAGRIKLRARLRMPACDTLEAVLRAKKARLRKTFQASACGGDACSPPGSATCPGGRVCNPDCTCPEPVCGDRIVDADRGEQCDPPRQGAQCGAEMACNEACGCAPVAVSCAPSEIVTTSLPGSLRVGTLPDFGFPSGVVTTIDVGPGDATARHEAIVPVGGFAVPTFCITPLGFTSDVITTGCVGGTADGRAVVWDTSASCPDADVSKSGDTRDGTCDADGPPPGVACVPVGPANALGNIDTVRGDAQCDPPGMHTVLDIPGRSITWNDNDGTQDCPDEDGVYDPGTDTLISDFSFVLSPTTAVAMARFADRNGDGCFRQGSGPNGPASLTGSPAPGPCCTVGQPTTLVAVGVAFSGGPPLFDLLFRSTTPATVTACNPWPGAGTCALDTGGGCLD